MQIEKKKFVGRVVSSQLVESFGNFFFFFFFFEIQKIGWKTKKKPKTRRSPTAKMQRPVFWPRQRPTEWRVGSGTVSLVGSSPSTQVRSSSSSSSSSSSFSLFSSFSAHFSSRRSEEAPSGAATNLQLLQHEDDCLFSAMQITRHFLFFRKKIATGFSRVWLV